MVAPVLLPIATVCDCEEIVPKGTVNASDVVDTVRIGFLVTTSVTGTVTLFVEPPVPVCAMTTLMTYVPALSTETVEYTRLRLRGCGVLVAVPPFWLRNSQFVVSVGPLTAVGMTE